MALAAPLEVEPPVVTATLVERLTTATPTVLATMAPKGGVFEIQQSAVLAVELERPPIMRLHP
jgi:hypothetical protein